MNPPPWAKRLRDVTSRYVVDEFTRVYRRLESLEAFERAIRTGPGGNWLFPEEPEKPADSTSAAGRKCKNCLGTGGKNGCTCPDCHGTGTPPAHEKRGHRFVPNPDRVGKWETCLNCGQQWPEYGDLAPMPECTGTAPAQAACDECDQLRAQLRKAETEAASILAAKEREFEAGREVREKLRGALRDCMKVCAPKCTTDTWTTDRLVTVVPGAVGDLRDDFRDMQAERDAARAEAQRLAQRALDGAYLRERAEKAEAERDEYAADLFKAFATLTLGLNLHWEWVSPRESRQALVNLCENVGHVRKRAEAAEASIAAKDARIADLTEERNEMHRACASEGHRADVAEAKIQSLADHLDASCAENLRQRKLYEAAEAALRKAEDERDAARDEADHNLTRWSEAVKRETEKDARIKRLESWQASATHYVATLEREKAAMAKVVEAARSVSAVLHAIHPCLRGLRDALAELDAASGNPAKSGG